MSPKTNNPGIFAISGLMIAFLALSMAAQQKASIKPLSENAGLPETQKWLTSALGKYAAYKTQVRKFTVSNARFTGCTLDYVLVSEIGSTVTETMGTTVTRSKSKKGIFDRP